MSDPLSSLVPGFKSPLLTPPSARAMRKLVSRRAEHAAEKWKRQKQVCATKKRYPSEFAARKFWADAEAKHGSELRIYRCVVCGGFHFTSRSAKE